MKKSDTPSTGTDSNLKRAEIIDLSQCYSDMHSIDVRKLMEMTEEEIIANVDPDIVKKVVSEALKKLIFETDEK